MPNIKWLMSEISDLEHDVNKAEEKLALCKEKMMIRRRQLHDAINSGDTTGDRMKDLIIRADLSGDAEIEAQYRKLEARLQGHAGELVLFTYTSHVCTKHVFMPTPGNEDVYEDRWYTGIGILKEDLLRIEDGHIVFAIDRYAFSSGDMPWGLKFVTNKCLQAGVYPIHLQLDTYADADATHRHGNQLCIGDDAVRAWFEVNGREGKALFKTCCDLLSKLFLEPTS